MAQKIRVKNTMTKLPDGSEVRVTTAKEWSHTLLTRKSPEGKIIETAWIKC